MALSHSSILLLCLALAAAVPRPLPAAAAAPAPRAPLLPINGKQKISVDAASSDVDGKTNTIVFKDIVVSQGATRVRADHARATGLNFQNSRWTFQGNVQIEI